MTGSSSAKLPRLIPGPLVNSPIDGGGPDTAEERNRKRKKEKPDRKEKTDRKEKPDRKDDKLHDDRTRRNWLEQQVCFAEDRGRNVEEEKSAGKLDIERREEAKMAKMEAHFRRKRAEVVKAGGGSGKSYAPLAVDSLTVLQPRRNNSSRSRERLASWMPPTDLNALVVNRELLATARAELERLNRQHDAPQRQNQTRYPAHADGVSPWDQTNNSTCQASRRHRVRPWWLLPKAVDNASGNI
ncbi:arginine/serine-rich coiled-coil protein 2-like [Mya arenaria]|uniref:arginine/serine-rich coiled-coil protein 2-like n=1 Tax=Mya arenaria TaxID=6604 RepID=UPI0022E7C93B|nr:arginine/serine-rich coiled-coil protein 2-like [Mya arenaria]